MEGSSSRRISDSRVTPGSLWVVLSDEKRDTTWSGPGLQLWKFPVPYTNNNDVVAVLRPGEMFLVEGVCHSESIHNPLGAWVRLIQWGAYVNRVHFNADSTGLRLICR